MKLSTKHILLAFQLMSALTTVSSFSQRPPSSRFRKDVDDMSFQEIQKLVTEMGYEVGTHDRAGLLMIAKGFPNAVRARRIGEQPAVRNVRGWNVSTSQANPQPASHKDGMAMVPYSPPPPPSQARQQQPIYQNIGPNSAYAQGSSQPRNRDVNVVKNSTAGQPSAWKNDVYGNQPGQRDLQTFTRGAPSGNARGNQNDNTAQNYDSAKRAQQNQQPMQRSNLSAYGDNLNSPRYRGTGGISDLSA